MDYKQYIFADIGHAILAVHLNEMSLKQLFYNYELSLTWKVILHTICYLFLSNRNPQSTTVP